MLCSAAMKSPRRPNRPRLRAEGPPPPTKPPRAAAPALARFSSGILAGLARKTRFVDPEIIARWPALAGPELSRLCRPGRLTGGRFGRTLEVIAPHGAAATSIEFEAEALRRRLNQHFGPDSINRIKVVLGPAPKAADHLPHGRLSRFRRGGAPQ